MLLSTPSVPKSGEIRYRYWKAQYRPAQRLDLTYNLSAFCLDDAIKCFHNQRISLLLRKRRSLNTSAVSKECANSKRISDSLSRGTRYFKEVLPMMC